MTDTVRVPREVVKLAADVVEQFYHWSFYGGLTYRPHSQREEVKALESALRACLSAPPSGLTADERAVIDRGIAALADIEERGAEGDWQAVADMLAILRRLR